MAGRGRNVSAGKGPKYHGIRMSSPEETPVYYTRASLVPTFIRGILPLIVAILVTVVAHFVKRDPTFTTLVALIALVLVLLTRIPGIARALSAPVVVSDRRLYMRHGFIDIDDHICSLASISDVHVDPDIPGRIFGYADVSVQTRAGERDFDMAAVKHAYRLRDEILRWSDEAVSGGRGQHDMQYSVPQGQPGQQPYGYGQSQGYDGPRR